MAKGWETLQAQTDVKERLKKIWEKDPKGMKFYGFVNQLLKEYVEHEERLQRYGAFIEYLKAVDNHINLFDNQLNKSVTVWINGKEKKLRCDHDERGDCVHVGFCFNVREVYDKLIDEGFRPPKKIS